jgi:hypothetical protein
MAMPEVLTCFTERFFSRFLISAVIFWGLLCSSSYATEGPTPRVKNDENSFSSIKTETEITCDNSVQFRELFIPEIFELICSDLGSIKATEKILYSWRMDDSFESANTMTLDKDLSLSTASELPRGFPFEKSANFESDIPTEESNRKLAAALLWNVNSHFWSNKIIWSAISISFRDSDLPLRTLIGEIKRFYPKALTSQDTTEQFFREVVSFREPSALKDLAFLTFRFTGMTEDFLWLYSPAISAVRQLTGHNRSDSIFRSAVSLDDFFLWSGKNELLEPAISEIISALVPFASISASRLLVDEMGCYQSENQLPGSSQQRRADLRSYWENIAQTRNQLVPEGLVFVPRKLFRLDIIPKDPYSHYGRQVMYVDQDSQLPIFKVVYDQSGAHWKTVIQVNGLGKTEDLSYKSLVPVYTLVFDRLNKSAALIAYSNTRFCSSFDKLPFNPQDFSPAGLYPSSSEVEVQDMPQ